MAYFKNMNGFSNFNAVEFSPRPEGNLAFFHGRSKEDMPGLKLRLEALGQKITAEPNDTLLVTQGSLTQNALSDKLASQGDRLVLPETKSAFRAWKWRGRFSDAGQLLNLASSVQGYIKTGQPIAEDKLAFALLNLSANQVNKIYGAQKTEDIHQLDFLKERINELLQDHLPEGAALPKVSEDRSALRAQPKPPASAGEKFNRFMQENSVRIGEIGLRYIGSIAMILPYKQFKEMGTKTVEGIATGAFQWKQALANIKNNPKGLINKDSTNLWTGAIYLIGKSIGLLFAKAPDPFNPKPKTAFDTFRENYAFRLSSLVEIGAAAKLAHGSYNKIDKEGKRDLLGAFGGASLVSGLSTRFCAPFGVKELDKNELYAHATDSLALMPKEKLPHLLAQTAALIKDNFQSNAETYGQIYMELSDRLYHERGINLNTQKADADLPVIQKPAATISFADKAARQPSQSFVARVVQTPQAAASIG